MPIIIKSCYNMCEIHQGCECILMYLKLREFYPAFGKM